MWELFFAPLEFMANLKETRRRIASIKSTQKITKAMKMVATARLKKVRNSLIALREYTAEVESIISNVLRQLQPEDLQKIQAHPLLSKASRGEDSHLFILNTSNKGLCGGVNALTLKAFKARVGELIARKRKVLVYCIGKKGYDFCNAYYRDLIVGKTFIQIDEGNVAKADEVKNEIIKIILERDVHSSSVIYSYFASTTVQVTKEFPLTPIHGFDAKNNFEPRHMHHEESAVFEFEDDKMELLNGLIPELMFAKTLECMFENATSEQSARMVAMDNATNNAGRAVKKLTLVYNRIRQASITREISEIVSGVESLK